jgi:hypothetical protein
MVGKTLTRGRCEVGVSKSGVRSKIIVQLARKLNG